MRSIRFRLIVWYASLLVVVVLSFGAYTYQRLETHLYRTLTDLLSHRADRIASTLIAHIPQTGEPYVVTEIDARYAPALNDKFVRVSRLNGSVLYLSGLPSDGSFDPHLIPAAPAASGTREEPVARGGKVVIVSIPAQAGADIYTVEVGASNAALSKVLRDVLGSLVIGLPLVLFIAIAGGYILINRALLPVRRLAEAAQEITMHNLGARLPAVRTGDELEALAGTLNRMIARLEDAFRSSGRFTADASHELRTPLTVIRGELESLLSDRALRGPMREVLGSLLEEAERLAKIVDGLLSLSRLDRGEAQAERVQFDLAALASATAEQMCLLAEEKDINLSCDTADPVEVVGDQSRLKQVIVNLLDNAIKYTSRGGTIVLRVSARDGNARLEVSDTGSGIPEIALPHVFERFFRADSTRSRDVEGTGLGLSIVHSICTAHGGSVSAENRATAGCRITAEIPLASQN